MSSTTTPIYKDTARGQMHRPAHIFHHLARYLPQAIPDPASQTTWPHRPGDPHPLDQAASCLAPVHPARPLRHSSDEAIAPRRPDPNRQSAR